MSMPYRIEQMPTGRETYSETVEDGDGRKRIELRSRPSGRTTPMKVYPDGRTVPASPEEVRVWDHVQGLESQVEELSAMLNEATAPEPKGRKPVAAK